VLRLLLIAAFLVVPGPLFGGGKKAPPLQVSFHLQAEPGESEKKLFRFPTAGQDITYRLSAELTQNDFVAFETFPADDKVSYGVIFQLNKVAAKRLANLSAAYRGRYLLAMVNGQVRDAVIIDQPVQDGLIVVWQRIGLAEIQIADQNMPRIGQDPAEWKQQLKAKQ
jgi:hypothetical protein